VSKDVAEASAMKGGRKGVSTGEVSGIPFSKRSKALSRALKSRPTWNARLLPKEDQEGNQTVWNDFIGEQHDALNAKVESFKSKNAFSDTPSKELGESVVAKIEDNFAAKRASSRSSTTRLRTPRPIPRASTTPLWPMPKRPWMASAPTRRNGLRQWRKRL